MKSGSCSNGFLGSALFGLVLEPPMEMTLKGSPEQLQALLVNPAVNGARDLATLDSAFLLMEDSYHQASAANTKLQGELDASRRQTEYEKSTTEHYKLLWNNEKNVSKDLRTLVNSLRDEIAILRTPVKTKPITEPKSVNCCGESTDGSCSD